MARSTGFRAWLRRRLGRGGPLIPVVRLQGVIAADTRPGRLNIQNVAPLLEKAFAFKAAPAVAVVINSPGGSPVQSRLISKRIRDLADEHGKPVLVFIEDAAASGGYFIAVAGDEIIADPSSIVGSIGVIYAGFGFPEALQKLGVERRVYTAGRNKTTLDPFLPVKEEDVERVKAIQRDVHAEFIDLVKARRGVRIEKAGDDLFTGEFWSGRKALELGLIDGLTDLRTKMRELYGDEVRFRLVTPSTSWLRRRRSVAIGDSASNFGFSPGGLAADLISAIEARALWSRFGF